MLQYEELRLKLLSHEDALNDLADALGLEKMKEEIAELEIQMNALKSRKQRLLEEKKQYSYEIQKYKEFFNSDECRETRSEINYYLRVIDEYQQGINALFNKTKNTVTYVEQLAGLGDSYQEMKNRLRSEIEEIKQLTGQMSLDYLDIVDMIEERVRL